MKKKLGFFSIVLLTINSIIGTGIFLSPGSVVAMSGRKALLVYCLAAIFAAVLAITFAAAAKYVTNGGAAYAYTKAAFGDDLGFYVGITRYIAASIAVIYIGIVGIAMMVNPQAIVQSTQVVALADVFDNPFIRMLIILGALISMFGINVAASFHTPRILEAMAIQKQIPQIFAKRTNKGFPLTAFMVTIGIVILLPMAFAFNMTSIIVLSSISRFIQFIIVPLAVIVFYFGKEKGETLKGVPNTFAITAMIIGYVILPIGMLI